jgi:hypothetical protein
MMKKYVPIIGGILAVVIGITAIMLSSQPNILDFSNASVENPLGISARVIMQKDTLVSCILQCNITATPHLILTSTVDSQFIAYEVCNNMSCKKDTLTDGLYVHMKNVPKNFSGTIYKELGEINLGDVSWKVGDIVHIKVKAFPAVLLQNETIKRYPEQTTVVDLGKSTIEIK